jgi:glycerol-3-phosphate dehydrogenase (NAD(P)+)
MALEEMIKLGIKLGAKEETFYYLSGLGDLLATSLSEHSHNRKIG